MKMNKNIKTKIFAGIISITMAINSLCIPVEASYYEADSLLVQKSDQESEADIIADIVSENTLDVDMEMYDEQSSAGDFELIPELISEKGSYNVGDIVPVKLYLGTVQFDEGEFIFDYDKDIFAQLDEDDIVIENSGYHHSANNPDYNMFFISSSKTPIINGHFLTVNLKVKQPFETSLFSCDIDLAYRGLTLDANNNTVSCTIENESQTPPAVKHNITYHLDGGTNSTSNPSKYTEGIEVVLEPATKQRYTFKGWYDNATFEGEAVTKIASTETTDVVLYAKFEEKAFGPVSIDDFKLIPEPGNYGIGDIVPVKLYVGELQARSYRVDILYEEDVFEEITQDDIVLSVPDKWRTIRYSQQYGRLLLTAASDVELPDGILLTYNFKVKQAFDSTEISADMEFYIGESDELYEDINDLKCTIENESQISPAVKYKITYHLDGGTNSTSNPPEYTEGTEVVLEPATKQGYAFKGWYDNASFEGEAVTKIASTATEDVVLYAKFEKNVSGPVSIDDIKLIPEPGSYGIGDIVPVKLYLENLHFDAGMFYFTYDRSIFEEFEEDDVIIENSKYYHVVNNSSSVPSVFMIESSKAPVISGHFLTINLKVKQPFKTSEFNCMIQLAYDGMCIIDVDDGTVSCTIENESQMPPADKHKITYHLDGGTNSTSNPSEYTEGTEVVLEPATKQGYTFKGWYDNASFEGEPVTKILSAETKDVVLYAKFEKNEFSPITADDVRLIPEKGSYNVGDAVPVRLYFDGAQFDAGIFDLDYDTDIFEQLDEEDEDGLIIEDRNYHITAINPDNGMFLVTSSRTPVINGLFLTINLKVKKAFESSAFSCNVNLSYRGIHAIEPDYYVVSCTIENESQTPPADKHKITYHLDGGTNSTSNPSEYTEGIEVVLEPATKQGYTFKGWYDNASFEGEAVAKIPSTATEDVVLYAKFEKVNTGTYDFKLLAESKSYKTGDTVPVKLYTDSLNVTNSFMTIDYDKEIFEELSASDIVVTDDEKHYKTYSTKSSSVQVYSHHGVTDLTLPGGILLTINFKVKKNFESTVVALTDCEFGDTESGFFVDEVDLSITINNTPTESAGSYSLESGVGAYKVGDTVPVELYVGSKNKLSRASFCLRYDREVFEDVTKDDISLSDSEKQDSLSYDPATHRVMISTSGDTPFNTSYGVLLTVNLKVKKEFATSDVSMEDAEFYNCEKDVLDEVEKIEITVSRMWFEAEPGNYGVGDTVPVKLYFGKAWFDVGTFGFRYDKNIFEQLDEDNIIIEHKRYYHTLNNHISDVSVFMIESSKGPVVSGHFLTINLKVKQPFETSKFSCEVQLAYLGGPVDNPNNATVSCTIENGSQTPPAAKHKITYHLDGGTNSASNPSEYTEGTEVVLEPATKQGYTFKGWYDNASFEGEAVTKIPSTETKDVVLYAKFEKNAFSPITADSFKLIQEAGSYGVGDIIPVKLYLEEVQFDTGFFTFEYDKNIFEQIEDEDIVIENKKFQITTSNPGENIFAIDCLHPPVIDGLFLTINLKVKKAFESSVFRCEPELAYIGEDLVDPNNATVSCTIENGSQTPPADKHKITYHLDGGTNSASNPSEYTEGTEVVLEPATKQGYTFKGWYDNASFEGEAVTKIPSTETKDVVLYAKFEKNAFSPITADDVRLIPEKGSYNVGDTVPVRLYLDGAQFDTGIFDLDYDTDIFEQLDEEDEDSLIIEDRKYHITAINPDNGMFLVTSSRTPVINGLFLTINLKVKKAFESSAFSCNVDLAYQGFPAIEPYPYVVSCTIENEFQAPPAAKHKITYHLDGGINSASNPSEYTEGTEVVLELATKQGHTFKGWYDNATFEGEAVTEIASTETRDIVLYAKFEKANTGTYDFKLFAENKSYKVGDTVPVKLYTDSLNVTNSFMTIDYDKEIFEELSASDIVVTDDEKHYKTYSAKSSSVQVYSRHGVTDLTLPDGILLTINFKVRKNFESTVVALTDCEFGDTESGFFVDEVDLSITINNNHDKFTVTFDTDGGTPVEAETVEAGGKVTKPANPTKEGYSFRGWYKDTTFSVLWDFDKDFVSSDVTIYAMWEANIYTIKFDGNGAIEGLMDDLKVSYGREVTLTKNAYKKVNADFIGWNTKADGTGLAYDDQALVLNLATENGATVILFAQWKPTNESENDPDDNTPTDTVKKKYSIIYCLDGGKNNPANPRSYDENSDTIILANPTKTNYRFAGWFSNASLKKRIVRIDAGSHGTLFLFAKWEPISYTVKFDRNGSDSGSMLNQKCNYDSVYELKANRYRKKHSVFIGWNTKADGTGTQYPNCGRIKNLAGVEGEEVVLYAQWKIGVYEVTYHLNGGINNPDNPDWYARNTETIKLKEPSREGYTFIAWYCDPELRIKTIGIPRESVSNKSFYAKWKANKYNVKFDGNGAAGHMSKLKNEKYDKKFALTTNKYKKKGYTFVGWNTSADGTGTPYKNKAIVRNLTAEANGTVILYAQWRQTEYKVMYKLKGGQNDPDNPTYYYIDSEDIVFAEPAKKGYVFAGWYSDSKYTKKITRIKSGSSGNKKVYAKWKKK